MTTENQNQDENQGSILDRATIVSITIGRLGIRRKVSSTRVKVRDAETETDPTMLAVSKDLIDCPQYDAIVSLDNESRTKILGLAVPSKLRRGSYMVPDTMLERVDGMLSEYQARRSHLIDAFLDVYRAAQENARGRLADLFDSADYPDPEDVRAAFTVSVRYDVYGTPSRLQGLSQRIYDRERDRVRADLRQASDEIRDAMRIALRDLIAHLSEVLKPGPDGKPRIFRDTTVDRLTEFLDTFADRNIAQDGELQRIAQQAREVLAGTTPDDLRRAPMLRDMVRNGLADVRAQLDSMTQTRGRRFTFEADAAPTPPADASTPGASADPAA